MQMMQGVRDHNRFSLQAKRLLLLYLLGPHNERSRLKAGCNGTFHLVEPLANAYVFKSEIYYYVGNMID